MSFLEKLKNFVNWKKENIFSILLLNFKTKVDRIISEEYPEGLYNFLDSIKNKVLITEEDLEKLILILQEIDFVTVNLLKVEWNKLAELFIQLKESKIDADEIFRWTLIWDIALKFENKNIEEFSVLESDIYWFIITLENMLKYNEKINEPDKFIDDIIKRLKDLKKNNYSIVDFSWWYKINYPLDSIIFSLQEFKKSLDIELPDILNLRKFWSFYKELKK